MTTFERPAPDLDKIVEAWQTWTVGGDDVLPGRTMADLKIGGVDRIFEMIETDADQVADSKAVWMGWESGKIPPGEALAGLTEAGFGDVVAALAELE